MWTRGVKKTVKTPERFRAAVALWHGCRHLLACEQAHANGDSIRASAASCTPRNLSSKNSKKTFARNMGQVIDHVLGTPEGFPTLCNRGTKRQKNGTTSSNMSLEPRRGSLFPVTEGSPTTGGNPRTISQVITHKGICRA